MSKVKSIVAVTGMFLASVAGLVSVASAADDGTKVVYTPSDAPVPGAAGVYVGAGLGQGRANLGLDLSNTGDMSYGFLGGYQFSRNLAAEVSYINLGKITTTVNSISGRTSGFGAAAVATAPINRSVAVYGKFGAAALSTNWDSSPSGTINSTQSATGLNWGAGLAFDAGKTATIRLGFDRYTLGTDDPATGSVTNISLTALLKF